MVLDADSEVGLYFIKFIDNLLVLIALEMLRFVNLVTDPNGGAKTPSSMMEAARKLNIPDWIVELRHEISHHHSLPKLSKVKEAMDVCWRWLQVN